VLSVVNKKNRTTDYTDAHR